MMKKIVLFILSWLIIFLIGIWLLVTTQRGLDTIIGATKIVLPGKLTIEKAQGKILGNINISNLSYEHHDTKITLSLLELNWRPSQLWKDQVDIQRLYVDHLHIHLPASQSSSSFEWEGIHLPFDIIIKDFSSDNVEFQQDSHSLFSVDHIELKAWSKRNILHINQLKLVAKLYQLSGQGFVGFSYPFSTQLTGTANYFLANAQSVYLNYSLQGNAKKAHAKIVITTPFSFILTATAKDIPNLGPVNIVSQWENLLMPLNKNNILSSKNGELKLSGELKNYRLNLNTDLAGNNIPKSNINLVAQGDIKQQSLAQFSISTLTGQITGQGKFNWLSNPSWSFNILGHNLNPATHWDCWPGKINFSLITHSINIKNRVEAYFELTQLHGELNNLPIQGRAIVQSDHTGWVIHQAQFSSTNNYLQASGRIDKTSSVQWNIKLLGLKQLTKSISGNILSEGNFSGSIKQPVIHANLLINDFHYNDSMIESLKSTIDFNLNHYSTIQVIGNNIYLKNQKINQINLDAKGDLAAHAIFANIQSQQGSLIFKAAGNYYQKNRDWHGILQQFTFNSTELGNWSLNQPILLNAGKIIKVSPFCWSSSHGALCGQGNFIEKNNWAVLLTLKHINLAMLQGFLPSTLTISSDMSGLINVSQQKHTSAHGDFHLQLNQATFDYIANKKTQGLQIINSYIKGGFDNKGLQTEFYLKDKQNQLPIHGNINLPEYHGNGLPELTSKINGNIIANWKTLQFLNLFIKAATNIDGLLNANLLLSGTLQQPKLGGQLNITNGQFDIAPLGLNLRAVTIKALLNNTDRIDLVGQLNSEKSVLNFTGYSMINPTFSPTVLQFKGTHVLAYHTDAYEVYITPNVTMNYLDQKLSFTGKIEVPEAHITPKDFTTTVELPDNVIFIGKNENIKPFPIYYNLNISLGDNVEVKYAGLNTKLAGSVTLNKEPLQILTAVGSLQTVKGYYQAYGQNLNIDTGNLLFTGGSVSNPNINILATKKITSDQTSETDPNSNGNMTVGIRVIGSMNNPKISFYSVPRMPNANVLSYLIFGQDSGSLSDSKFQLLSQAASSMGVSGAGLIDSIKGQLSLSQLGIESGQVYNPQTQQVQQNTSFVLGKQLSKKLSVDYSIGILVPVNILKIKYILSKHFFLQSDASAFGSGADIIYSLQTN